MGIKQYIADAFTDRLFAGNQAAVCLPDNPLDENLMQKIAIENNFSETAFAVKTPEGYNLRWFTPGGEIDLCGHATLATAFVIMTQEDPVCQKIVFSTKSGSLIVEKDGNLFKMNFPQAHKTAINAYQASKRGGKLICDILPNGRINISGPCTIYSKATLYI